MDAIGIGTLALALVAMLLAVITIILAFTQSGPVGPAGTAGPRGPTGMQADAGGNTGPRGGTGITGPNGIGASGTQGHQGQRGPTGVTGSAGAAISNLPALYTLINQNNVTVAANGIIPLSNPLITPRYNNNNGAIVLDVGSNGITVSAAGWYLFKWYMQFNQPRSVQIGLLNVTTGAYAALAQGDGYSSTSGEAVEVYGDVVIPVTSTNTTFRFINLTDGTVTLRLGNDVSVNGLAYSISITVIRIA